MKLGDESGQVAVFAGVMFTGLLLAVGLVIDVGGWHADQARLQEGADAAAVSGAQFYLDGTAEPASSPCNGIASAVLCAQHVADLNRIPLAPGSPQLVTQSGVTGVQVIAKDTSPPNFIARMIGINPAITATSTASAVGPASDTNPIPIAVTKDAASQWQSRQQLTLKFEDLSSYSPSISDGFIGIAFVTNNSTFTCSSSQGLSHFAGCIGNGCGASCTINDGDVLQH